MKKYGIALWLLFVLLLSGCSGLTGGRGPIWNGKQDKAVLYFANKEGTDLIAVDLDVQDKSQEELPAFIMEKLLEGPAGTTFSNPIRIGTRLLSADREENLVTVDVSKEFYHEESIYDVLAQASIVKSLCSISGVDSVYITVEGQPMQNASGEMIGILKESEVVFDADALMTDESNVTLYFSDANAECLVREIRRIRVPRGETMEKLVVTELIDGPQSSYASRTVPKETKIRSVETKEGVCFVNLSSEFVTRNNVGTSAERLTVYSIVNSLTELSNVDRVQFLIEGERKETYHHMIFNEPIERDVSMIQK
ncbi:MAG: hypothetical protein E7402_03445 [Ruminococcaceae bacterium]|nr:hypothetical protein [Oscillospiraceae bacterium]